MADINDIVSSDDVQRIINLNNALQGTAKQIGAVNAENEKLQKQLDEAAKATNDLTVKSTAYTQILNATEKEQVKINATAKQMQAQQQQLIDIEAKLAVAHSAENKSLIAKRIALQEATKAEKEKLKVDQAEEGSLNRMRQRLAELTKAYDNAGVRTKEAAKEILTLSNNVSAAEQATGRYGRTVGDYKTGILGLGKAFITGQIGIPGLIAGIKAIGVSIASIPIIGWVAAAVTALALLAKALISNAQEFDKASSSLSAITGSVGEDLDFMKKKAIEFSKTSLSSATDIVKAFEKVGSAMPALLTNGELLTSVTKDFITLSEASGGSLSVTDAALAGAAAFNQFNIPLTESARVVNALAAGSLAGSAEVSDLAESFKNAGTVADSAGMSLEQTVGALEVLGEKSLYGAEAGTKLRGAILKLQAAGLGYASGVFNYRDALVEANAQLETQGTAMEKDALAAKLFGAENITAGKILVDNIDKYDSLTAAIEANKTAAEDMSKTQKNNLDSSYKLLGNAWKGLMLTMEDGSGIIMKAWKGIIDGITWTLNAISSVSDKFRSKEQKEAKKAAIEQEAAEERKRASLMKTAEQMGITIDEKMSIADIEKKINEEVLKQNNEIAKQDADAAKKASDARKKRLEDTIKEQEETAKRVEANSKLNADIAKAENELDKWLSEQTAEINEQDMKVAEASTEFMLGEAEREYRRKVMLINATSKSEEEAAKKIYELDVQSAQASIDTMNNAMNSINASEEEKWAYKEKIAAAQMDLDEMVAEHGIATAEEEGAKKKKLLESLYDASKQIASGLFDFMDAKYSGELTVLEQKNEAGLLSDKEYATQKAEIEIKQAKASRTRAIFEATLGVAEAIVSAMQTKPFLPLGLIAAATAGITGALQIASILSTPLPTMPAFEHGTLNAPETFRAAERNKRELGYLNNGDVVMFEKDGIYSDPKFKGARIVPNAMTEAIISRTQAPTYNQSSMSDTRIVNELKAVRKSIDNSQKPIIDSRGEIIGTYNRNHREFNRSKRYTPWA